MSEPQDVWNWHSRDESTARTAAVSALLTGGPYSCSRASDGSSTLTKTTIAVSPGGAAPVTSVIPAL